MSLKKGNIIIAGLNTQVSTNANISDVTNKRFVTDAQLATINGISNRNLLINPAFNINQRVYVSGTNTTGANQVTLDRWRVVTSGQALSFSTSNGVVTATCPAGGIEQILFSTDFIGGTYVLSWTGTALGYVDGTQVVSGAPFTLTGGSNHVIKFTNGTLSCPKLELGTNITPYVPRSFSEELALCQQDFEKSYDLETALGTIWGEGYVTLVCSSNIFQIYIPFKTPKRFIPSVSLYNIINSGAVGTWRNFTDSTDLAVSSVVGKNRINIFNNATPTAGKVYLGHWAVSTGY